MTKHIYMATMRSSLLFILLAIFLVDESLAYASSSACALVNGQWICQNNRNNGNGNSAAAVSTGNNGNVFAGPISPNNEETDDDDDEQEPNENIPYNNVPAPRPFNNGPVFTSGAGAWAGPLPNGANFDEILRNPFKMLSLYNGNGNSAGAISGGDRRVHAGPLPMNNEQIADSNERQPIYNQNIPNNNVPVPNNKVPIPYKNGQMMTYSSSSSACALINGNWVCQNDRNDGNGNSAAAISTGDNGNVYAGPLPLNNERQTVHNNEPQPNEKIPYSSVPVQNNKEPIPYKNGQMVSHTSSSACALINGNWVCQNDLNDGNGNSAAAISTGDNGNVYAGPLPLNNERQVVQGNEPQPNEKIPYNNVPVPRPFNNGQVVTSGVWTGPQPNNNGFIPNFNEILRNPFSMLNFPQRPQVPRN